MMIEKQQNILIVGGHDLIEQSLTDHFKSHGHGNVFSSSAMGLDVTNQRIVEDFFVQHKPDYVFLGSTRSGGIVANQRNPADFIYHNLVAETTVIQMAQRCGVKKLMFFASSCIYPARARQPLREEYLLTGPLEPSNEPYSIAKIAGIKLCQSFRAQYGLNAVVMIPATLYGPGEIANLENSHVLDALIRKFSDAVKEGKSEVVVWGSGRPCREFLFVDDFVDAAIFLMEEYNGADLINVGWGNDIAIKDLAELVAEATGFKGKIIFDRSKPDGTMRKVLDCRRMSALGWKPKVELAEGIRKTLENMGKLS